MFGKSASKDLALVAAAAALGIGDGSMTTAKADCNMTYVYQCYYAAGPGADEVDWFVCMMRGGCS